MDGETTALIQKAIAAYRRGNFMLADVLCHDLLDRGVTHSTLHEILGHIAFMSGDYERALQHLQRMIDSGAATQSTIDITKEAQSRLAASPHTAKPRESYLLIKTWGNGFWADVDHVLGQLLLAEITGRIPVVHWSSASLFSDGSGKNAFEHYFEPVSEYAIDDLVSPKLSYYPPKWSVANLLDDNVNKYSGQYSCMGALSYLNRPEDVLVSDYHTYVNSIRHWLPPAHPLFGKSCESVYRYLFRKYIRLNTDRRDDVEVFRVQHLVSGDCLAVHVRGGDKIEEDRDLWDINASYHAEIEKRLAKEPNLSIFLLTDSEPVLDEYHRRYPGKVISTRCKRTQTNVGVHIQYQDNKLRNGIEVVRDTYLAAECKYFIGYGLSNVSTAVCHIKDWDEGHCTLLPFNILYKPPFILHDW